MPFAPSSPQDEELKKKQGESQATNVSGSSTSFSTGVPGQESAAPKDQKSSGQYANIQSYLDANKDQADTMGTQISSNIENKGSEAKTAVEVFGAKAPKVAEYDPNAALGRVTSLNDQEKQDYRTQRQTGGYSGPQSIDQAEGYADTQKKAQEAATLAKNAASETGQQQLLKDTFSRPTYSAGQNKLDQVLLQGSAGSKQALQGVASKYGNLDQLFNDAQNNFGASINSAKAQALKNKENISAAEKAAREGLINPIQQRAAEQNSANQALIGRAQGDLQDETVAGDLLAQLGLNEGQNLFDLNLGNYLGTDATQVGLNQAANAEERAKYAALANLFEDQSMNQIDANGKAVTPISFDKERFGKDTAAKQAEYDNAYNNQDLGISGFVGPATPVKVQQGIQNYRNNAAQALATGDQTVANFYTRNADIMQQKLDAFNNSFKINRKVQKG
jgi:hypothetical protein